MKFSDHSRSRLKVALFVIFLLTLKGLLDAATFVTDRLANRLPPYASRYLIYEMTGVYSFLILLPLLLWLFRAYPLMRGNLTVRIPLYLAVSVVFGVTHTMLMYLSRTWIFRVGGLGVYDYGQLEFRFVMEYTKQFLSFWLVYGIVYAIRAYRESQEQRVRTVELEQQLTKARLQALQMQLSPHFLFNTLNMISATMYEDVGVADRMMANLSDLLRASFRRPDVEEHTLEEELHFTSLYVAIMKARYENKLTVDMHADDQALKAFVPRFILQPLVENSIKYSIENAGHASVNIHACIEAGTVRLSVRDNGPGIDAKGDRSLREGVGLSNTMERLDTLYGGGQRFQMQNLNQGGCETVITIPCRNHAAAPHPDR